jgi:hypothetical protein
MYGHSAPTGLASFSRSFASKAGHLPLRPRPAPSDHRRSSVQVPSRIHLTVAGATPDLGPGADAMRHLYDHTDVVTGLRRSARASVPGTHHPTAAAASFDDRGVARTGAGADR